VALLTTLIVSTTKREPLTKLMACKSSTPEEEAAIEVVKEVAEEVAIEVVIEVVKEAAEEVAIEAASSTNVERAIKVAIKTASMTLNMRKKNNTTIKMMKSHKISKETTTIVQPRQNIEPKSNTMRISITTIRISKMASTNTDKRPLEEAMATTKAEVMEAMKTEEALELNTVVIINSNSNIKIKRLIQRSHMKIKRDSNLWERLVRFLPSIKKMLYRRKSKRSSLK